MYITLINDANNTQYSLLRMVVTPWYVVFGSHTMYLVGAILSTGNHMLIDIGVMHNFVHINFMRLLVLLEHCINTTFIVGSSNEAPHRAMAFATLLRINIVIFDIDTHLLDINNMNNYTNNFATTLTWLMAQREDTLIEEGESSDI
jgi:hypothetical protein